MMLKSKTVALIAALVLSGAGAALAGSVTEAITEQLRGQGYTQVTVTRTFLGRDRIVASGPAREREIIVNPRTNEILRDYVDSRAEDGTPGFGRTLLDLFSLAQGSRAKQGATENGSGGHGDGGIDGGPGDDGNGGEGAGGDGDGDGGEGGDD